MSVQKEVWVIGSKNTVADKNIDWLEKFPNLSDPDVLIINMKSLTGEILTKMGIMKITELNTAIIDKFRTGGTVILITTPEIKSQDGLYNYWICPVNCNVKNVPEGKRLNYDLKNPYHKYLEQVGGFSFYFENFDTKIMQDKIGNAIISMIINMPNSQVYDNSGHLIGTSYGNYVQKWASTTNKAHYYGSLVLLPPTTKIPVDEGIEIILQLFGKDKVQEQMPEWVEKVNVNGFEKFSEKLKKLEIEKLKIQQNIQENYEGIGKIRNFTKLLYARDSELEEVVHDAFRLLGFTEIDKKRDSKREDWVFEFESKNKCFDYGIIEVKGTDAKSKQYHLTQCSKWVDEIFHETGKLGKGIFIINQFRLSSYLDSKEKRLNFEPNEIEYAKMKGICILPSCILFDWVNSFLGGKKKSRKTLEQTLQNTNGVIKK